MSLFHAVVEHMTGGNVDFGFYVFECPKRKCKYRWAKPAIDPSIWVSGEVSDHRWVSPSATCPKCRTRAISNDDFWCADPDELRKRHLEERRKNRSTGQVYAGLLPAKSYGLFSATELVDLHVRVKVVEPSANGNSFTLTSYDLFDDQDRIYSCNVAPNIVRRVVDGCLGIWLTELDMVEFFQSHLITDMESWSSFSKDELSLYKRIKEDE